MRYIDLDSAIASLPQNICQRIKTAHDSMAGLTDEEIEEAARSGDARWKSTKPFLEAISNRKCWYTESRNQGCTNDVDHFRPKAKVVDSLGNITHWYWFLTFQPTNYRLSCQISNRPNHNAVFGVTGGKHNHFPLLNGGMHGNNFIELLTEEPILLDPCNQEDTKLLEFETDGRPVISKRHAANVVAKERVERSKLLLNLDYPTFNEDREILYNKIKRLVKRGDQYLAAGLAEISDVKEDLSELMGPEAEYSKAAECYIRCFRNRDWVEDLLFS